MSDEKQKYLRKQKLQLLILVFLLVLGLVVLIAFGSQLIPSPLVIGLLILSDIVILIRYAWMQVLFIRRLQIIIN